MTVHSWSALCKGHSLPAMGLKKFSHSHLDPEPRSGCFAKLWTNFQGLRRRRWWWRWGRVILSFCLCGWWCCHVWCWTVWRCHAWCWTVWRCHAWRWTAMLGAGLFGAAMLGGGLRGSVTLAAFSLPSSSTSLLSVKASLGRSSKGMCGDDVSEQFRGLLKDITSLQKMYQQSTSLNFLQKDGRGCNGSLAPQQEPIPTPLAGLASGQLSLEHSLR